VLRDLAEQVDQRLVDLDGLRGKTGQGAAEVGAVEFGVFIDLARQETLSKRAVRHQADSEFLERGYYFLLRFSPPQRVFALECGDWLDSVCAADGICSCFGKPEVLNLTGLNQLLHRARDVLDRHARIHTVLIQQVDALQPKSLE
jgi:hypothetical protein